MKVRTNMRGLIAGLALSASTLCSAQTTYGMYDCGQWFKPNFQIASHAWVLGYLSGLNIMWSKLDKGTNPLGGLSSAEAGYLWMDNYCRAHPLETLDSGATTLFSELIDRERAAKR